MKVVLLCDYIDRIPEFRARFAAGGHGDDLMFVVANNRRRILPLFLASQLRSFLRFGLRDWLSFMRELLARRVFISTAPVDSAAIAAFLDRAKPDLALHAMGAIYRDQTIRRCGLGILNAHIGQLPKYRGRSVMEWSLLCGDPTGVTVFFIDAGIDTGRRMVFFQPVSVAGIPNLDKAKRHLFSQDVELYYRAVDRLRNGAAFEDNDVSQGRRFYEMSALFRDTLQSHLERDAGPGKLLAEQDDSKQ
jgi:folate-dependent phosphoribosylglycinamide formyltransferase PurN